MLPSLPLHQLKETLTVQWCNNFIREGRMKTFISQSVCYIWNWQISRIKCFSKKNMKVFQLAKQFVDGPRLAFMISTNSQNQIMICWQDKFIHYYSKQKHTLAHGILQIFHKFDVKLKVWGDGGSAERIGPKYNKCMTMLNWFTCRNNRCKNNTQFDFLLEITLEQDLISYTLTSGTRNLPIVLVKIFDRDM